MAKHPHPKDVPGLEQVVKALERAARVPTEGPLFELCIRNRTGEIVAAMTVQGFERVKHFSRRMATLGYAADVLGDDGVPCDVLYIQSSEVRDIFDDGAPNSGPVPLN